MSSKIITMRLFGRRTMLFIVVVLFSGLYLTSCVITDELEEINPDDDVVKENNDEKLNLFYGTGYEGEFQDDNNLIILGTSNDKEHKVPRLYRISKEGIQDTSFNDQELYESSELTLWSNLLVNRDGILIKGYFNVDGKQYVLAKTDKDGKLDRQFINNLPKEFIFDPNSSRRLSQIVNHEDTYYCVFNDQIVKINRSGLIDSDFRMNFGIPPGNGRFYEITILADGKIMVLGQFEIIYGGKTYKDILRMDPFGKIDENFMFQYELESDNPDGNSLLNGSASKLFHLNDGGYLLQGNFNNLTDHINHLDFDYFGLVKLDKDFKVDESFSKLVLDGPKYWDQLPDGRLIFFRKRSETRGFLLLIDQKNGLPLKEVNIGLHIIGLSSPVIKDA